MTRELIFRCEGHDLTIDLSAGQGTEALRQLLAWVPAEITIHCAKIAGCHIYWPSPVLSRLERGHDIHTLKPGAFLYYPDRQYLELIYDELQAETAAVVHLGQLVGGIDWLREFATRQRREAGTRPFVATLQQPGETAGPPDMPADDPSPLGRIRRARHAVWSAEPAEVWHMLARSGHNIPFGPMATADGYFRTVQESLWQLWTTPDRFDDAARRAAAINAIELGISRIGGYCHLTDSTSVLEDALEAITAGDAALQDVFAEVILYCSRMSNWVDMHIPWHAANEVTKRALNRSN